MAIGVASRSARSMVGNGRHWSGHGNRDGNGYGSRGRGWGLLDDLVDGLRLLAAAIGSSVGGMIMAIRLATGIAMAMGVDLAC